MYVFLSLPYFIIEKKKSNNFRLAFFFYPIE